jgi:hypothetical protein
MNDCKFAAGMALKAVVPFMQPRPAKVYIDHVLPSVYKGEYLIVYRVFGKHKRYWHEFLCTEMDMQFYKEKANTK